MEPLSQEEIDALLRAMQAQEPTETAAETPAEAPALEQEALPAASSSGEPLVQLEDVEVEVTVHVGGGIYPLGTLADLRPGDVLALDTEAGEPAVLTVGGRVVGLGEIVLLEDDTLGVRITRPVPAGEARAATPAWLRAPHRPAAIRARAHGPTPA